MATNHYLAAAHAVSPFITVYDTSGWSKLSSPPTLPAGTTTGVAFSPDASLLAVASPSEPLGEEIVIYDTTSWSKLSSPPTGPGAFGALGVAFSRDGGLLVGCGSSSPYLIIFDTSDWSRLSDPSSLPAGSCRRADFSPDGSLLALASSVSPYLIIYDTSGWSRVYPSSDPPGPANGVSFSPDGSLLAVAHDSSPYVTVYNTSDWSKRSDPSVLPTPGGKGVAFSPDGTMLAVSRDTFFSSTRVYDTSTWNEIVFPSGGLGSTDVNDIAFSPDSSLMSLGSKLSSPLGYVARWTTSPPAFIISYFPPPAGPVYGVAFGDYNTPTSTPTPTATPTPTGTPTLTPTPTVTPTLTGTPSPAVLTAWRGVIVLHGQNASAANPVSGGWYAPGETDATAGLSHLVEADGADSVKNPVVGSGGEVDQTGIEAPPPGGTS